MNRVFEAGIDPVHRKPYRDLTGLELASLLVTHAYLYYEMDSPIISDSENDELCRYVLKHRWADVAETWYVKRCTMFDQADLSATSLCGIAGKWPPSIRYVGNKLIEEYYGKDRLKENGNE